MLRILLIISTLSSCSLYKVKREISSVNFDESCIESMRAFLKIDGIVFDTMNIDIIANKSDSSSNSISVKNHLDSIGISSKLVKFENNNFGVELLADQNSVLSRYIGRVKKKFNDVRIFYIDDPNFSSKGTFVSRYNHIYLHKDVALSIEESGFVTLSHEIRHAFFLNKVFHEVNGPYRGKIQALKGSLSQSELVGYASYMSLEEISTFKEDSRKFLNLWLKKIEREGIVDNVLLDKFATKSHVANIFINRAAHYLNLMEVEIIKGKSEFDISTGLLMSKTFIKDGENEINIFFPIISNAKHITNDRKILEDDLMNQISIEYTQMQIDSMILKSHITFLNQLSEFEQDKMILFAKIIRANSLVNSRSLLVSSLQSKFTKLSGQEVSDAQAIEQFAKFLKEADIVFESGRTIIKNDNIEIAFNPLWEIK